MNDEKDFIPSIYNYCDRWCERCEFTARCRVYEMEQQFLVDDEGPSMESAIRQVGEIFADTKLMLQEAAEKYDIDLDSKESEEAYLEYRRETEKLQQDPLVKMARSYALETGAYLKTADGEPELLETVIQYFMFIPVKIYGAMLDEDGGDGSIKTR